MITPSTWTVTVNHPSEHGKIEHWLVLDTELAGFLKVLAFNHREFSVRRYLGGVGGGGSR